MPILKMPDEEWFTGCFFLLFPCHLRSLRFDALRGQHPHRCQPLRRSRGADGPKKRMNCKDQRREVKVTDNKYLSSKNLRMDACEQQAKRCASVVYLLLRVEILTEPCKTI